MPQLRHYVFVLFKFEAGDRYVLNHFIWIDCNRSSSFPSSRSDHRGFCYTAPERWRLAPESHSALSSGGDIAGYVFLPESLSYFICSRMHQLCFALYPFFAAKSIDGSLPTSSIFCRIDFLKRPSLVMEAVCSF